MVFSAYQRTALQSCTACILLVALLVFTQANNVSGATMTNTTPNGQLCTTGQVAGFTGLVMELCSASSYKLFQPIVLNITVTNIGTSFATLRFAYNVSITGTAWSASTLFFGLCAQLVCVFNPGDSISQTITFVTAPPGVFLFSRNPAPPGEYFVEASLLSCSIQGFLTVCDQPVATTSLQFNIVA